jgi:hypothetical protein
MGAFTFLRVVRVFLIFPKYAIVNVDFDMGTTKNGKTQLSPSALNIFLECPRCFWLEYGQSVRRPRGIFPSLPGGMDLLIKKYFDRYRAVGKIPPELEGKVEGQLLADPETLNKWRSWRSGLSFYDKETNAVLVGALDDCMVHDGYYIPVDYKTRGFDLNDGDERHYQNQLNCYSFLVSAVKLPQPDYAYLVYYIPKEVAEQGQVRFEITVKKLVTYPHDALDTFRRAVHVLSQEISPQSSELCHYCSWVTQRV